MILLGQTGCIVVVSMVVQRIKNNDKNPLTANTNQSKLYYLGLIFNVLFGVGYYYISQENKFLFYLFSLMISFLTYCTGKVKDFDAQITNQSIGSDLILGFINLFPVLAIHSNKQFIYLNTMILMLYMICLNYIS